MDQPVVAPTPGDILVGAARDGSMDLAAWPEVLELVLSRLQLNVHTEFPLPPTRDPLPATSTLDSNTQTTPTPHERLPASQAEPSSSGVPNDSTAPNPDAAASTTNGNEPSTVGNVNGTGHPAAGPVQSDSGNAVTGIPSQSLALYNACVDTLKNSFGRAPPYNVQRLAELVLDPRRHYRFLPPYLAALDQVLSVSSTVADFPMLQPQVSAGSTFLTNGEASAAAGTEGEGLINDENLGGALLTPIPWLRRDSQGHLIVAAQQPASDTQPHEQIQAQATDSNTDPPTDDGTRQPTQDPSMSTQQSLRAEGAVTQGELLRQEQEAGVVPVAQTRGVQMAMNGLSTHTTTSSDHHTSDGPIESIESTEADAPPVEQPPHARGPEAIGMEDTGPQHDVVGAGRPLDLEGAVGRGRSQSPQLPDDDSRGQQQPEQVQGQGQVEAGSQGQSEGSTTGHRQEQDQEMSDAA